MNARPGIDRPDEGLTYESLKQELIHQYKQDARFKPFVDLFKAAEDPEIDFASPEVDSIIRQMQELNEGPGMKVKPPPRPAYKVVPFTLPDDASADGFAAHAEGSGDLMQRSVIPTGLFWPGTSKTQPFAETAGDPDIERVIGEDAFQNWGKNVSFRASYTLVVRSIAGVCKVVKWAAAKGKKVRVAGFRHSWSDVFGANGDVVIMFLPYATLVNLPHSDPTPDFKTELSGITPVASVAGRAAPAGHGFYKVMAGTTNETFRQWAFKERAFCLPLNVIMVEVTFGGTNAPICHGAGLGTSTLSDLVVEVQYVDATGTVRTVNDPAELKAASGAFGLLGVVVALTLQLDVMGVTDMMPVKLPMPLAIPPPPGYKLPYEVQKMVTEKKITPADFAAAQKEFERRCEEDYYLEWFWFPYQEDVWVNTWSKRPITAKDVDLQAYPSGGFFNLNGVEWQKRQAAFLEAIIEYVPFLWSSGRTQASVFGCASLWMLPSITDKANAIRTLQSEAQHFRRGIQNFRCWDTEWEIPVAQIQGNPDYERIQRAWWDGITAIYSRKDAPVRIALEMRLTGGSDVLLAPQRGNTYTASIEVLTTLITPQDDWATFMQTVADAWTLYPPVYDAHGHELFPRPHWAKQWAGVMVRGKRIERYFKEDAYKGSFAQFREAFNRIVEKNGSTVDKTLELFGNDLMERLIFRE